MSFSNTHVKPLTMIFAFALMAQDYILVIPSNTLVSKLILISLENLIYISCIANKLTRANGALVKLVTIYLLMSY